MRPSRDLPPDSTIRIREQCEAALEYRRRGLAIIDVPFRSKNPGRRGWQLERLTEDELRTRFGCRPRNVGVLLGEPSGNLADVDLDATEALALADRLLPPTESVFGRPSKPRSHRLYYANTSVATAQYRDPLASKDEAMLVELRSTGVQTLIPPSVHPSGEASTWDCDGTPAVLDGEDLRRAVAEVAVATLLVRYYPPSGSRHDAMNALAGGLLRADWGPEKVATFIVAIAAAAGDEEAKDRPTGVRTTMSRLAHDGAATGWPRLAELLGDGIGEKVVAAVRDWVGGSTAAPDSASTDTDAPPAWTPSPLITDEERDAKARDTFLDRYIQYGESRTDAPWIFHEALGCVLLSAVIGRRAVLRLSQGEIYPSLWVMIIANSTRYRKSTSLDLMRDVLERVSPDLLAPNEFTPQRFVAIMAENDGRPLTFTRDEYGGFYEALNRLDYMLGLKDLLCDIFDGRPFRREKMKPKGSASNPVDDTDWKFDVREPFLSQAVGTTTQRFLDVARPSDLFSGFLVRFAYVIPSGPTVRKAITDWTTALEAARTGLVNELTRLQHTQIRLTCEQEVVTRFNRYVDELEDQAQAAPDSDLVGVIGARISWMALRIAMLLAVTDGTQRISLSHLLRGIDIAERWRASAIGVLGGLAPSKFEQQAARLVTLVIAKGEAGISRRDAMRSLKLSKREMTDLEATLDERGEFSINRVTGGGPERVRYVAPGGSLSPPSPLSPRPVSPPPPPAASSDHLRESGAGGVDAASHPTSETSTAGGAPGDSGDGGDSAIVEGDQHGRANGHTPVVVDGDGWGRI